MMQTPPVLLLEKYNRSFRELINKKNRRSKGNIQTILKLSQPEDWTMICTAMDIIDDTCMAIEHFLRFGMSGSTKYDDMGEKYLRLYGILNATYLQQEAIYNLSKLSGLPDSAGVENKIASLKVREARYKLASDSNGYVNPKSGIMETFFPVQAELSDFACGCWNNTANKKESFNLKKCLEVHLNLMIDLYDRIYEKAIDTHFKSPKKIREGLLEDLSDLRLIRSGGRITELPNGRKLRIEAPIIVASNLIEDDKE